MKRYVCVLRCVCVALTLFFVAALPGYASEKRREDAVTVIRYDDNATILYGCPGEKIRVLKTSSSLAATNNDEKQEKQNILIYDCNNSDKHRGKHHSKKKPRVIHYDSNADISYITPEGTIRKLKTSSRIATPGKKEKKPQNILIYDPSRIQPQHPQIILPNSPIIIQSTSGTTNIEITGK